MDPDKISMKSHHSKKKMKLPKLNIYYAYGLGVIIVLVLIYFFLIKPLFFGYSMQGYFKENEMTIDQVTSNFGELKSQKALLEQNVNSCQGQVETLNKQVQDQKQSAANIQAQLTGEKQTCLANLDSLQKEQRRLQNASQEQLSELEELRDDYSDLRKFAARTICCKEKVDDSSIDSYDIDDGRITCGNGENYKLTC